MWQCLLGTEGLVLVAQLGGAHLGVGLAVEYAYVRSSTFNQKMFKLKFASFLEFTISYSEIRQVNIKKDIWKRYLDCKFIELYISRKETLSKDKIKEKSLKGEFSWISMFVECTYINNSSDRTGMDLFHWPKMQTENQVL